MSKLTIKDVGEHLLSMVEAGSIIAYLNDEGEVIYQLIEHATIDTISRSLTADEIYRMELDNDGDPL